MKKIFLFIVLFALNFQVGFSQFKKNKQNNVDLTKIQWISMSEAIKLSSKSKKKIIIDFYTDWCGWCKKMDKATYEDPKIIKYINENFHAVKFNAEREDSIVFLGKTYKMPISERRATHELAVKLLDGRMGYPSTTILNSDLSKIQNISGYIEPDMMFMALNYFRQDLHKTTPFEKFKDTFNP